MTCIACAAAFATFLPASATAQSAPTVTGTWSCCGEGGAGPQIWTITESNGTLSGSGPTVGPIHGSISGTSVTIVTGPYPNGSYEATFVGTIAADGESMSGTWIGEQGGPGQEGTWTATRTSGSPTKTVSEEEATKKTEEARKKKEEEEKAGKRASAVSVSCYYEFLTTLDICTAQVGDASGQQPAKIPTGNVAFTINPGGVGGFQGSSTCALAPSQTGGASSFCAVDYKSPSLEVPIGQQPPITATYSGDSNFTASSSSPKDVKGENPLEEIPELCLAADVNCEGIDLTLPAEPTINELDETELSLGCYDQQSSPPPANDASAASAHAGPSAYIGPSAPASPLAYASPFAHISETSIGSGIPVPAVPPLTPPKNSATCKVRAQIEATKKAQTKIVKKLNLLQQKLDVEIKLEPLNQKKQQLDKALKEVSDAWGNEEPEAVEASLAGRKHSKHKVSKPAIPFGAVTVEVPDHDRRNVKVAVPNSDRIFVTVLRDAHISVLHLQIRITVVRTADKKATSFTKTAAYKLSKK